MNEHLKFSWGHIIAFLALIFVSYISFVGVTYLTDGKFAIAAIAMVVIDIFLALFFIGAQVMKATDHKFARRIWVERIFVFGSPLVFIICMIPYFHFWTVYSHDDEVVNNFTSAISASKQMFDDYETYSNTRIDNYSKMLDNAKADKSSREYVQCGFTAGKESIQKGDMVKTLRLQLLSENYDELKTSAIKWIDESCVGTSTFNVFLLGNAKEIKTAIHLWNDQLNGFASKKLNNEEYGNNEVLDFKDQCGSLNSVDEGLDSLTKVFTDMHFPNIIALLTALVLYFALLFPYFLQDRYSKSLYRLIGMDKNATNGGFSITPNKPAPGKNEKASSSGEDSLVMGGNDGGEDSTERAGESSDTDDFGSFTL